MIGHLLKTYVDYHRPAAKAGFGLFDNLAEEKVDKFDSDWVEFDPNEQMNVFRQDYKLSHYIATLCDWLKVSEFSFSQDRTEYDETITIRFDKYSGSLSSSLLSLPLIRPITTQ